MEELFARSPTDDHLHSASATETTRVTFSDAKAHAFPIVAFRCIYPFTTCVMAKEWLLDRFDCHDDCDPAVVRMEHQRLSELSDDTEGTMLLLEFAAWSSKRSGASATRPQPVSILSLHMPGDPRIRWFYCLAPLSSLLGALDALGCIAIRKTFGPGTRSHRRIFTFLAEAFQHALRVPEHPVYTRAMAIVDCAPDIADESAALARLERSEFLYYQRPGSDISDDRYLLHLPAAERELASLMHLRCAEYLLVKRVFFRDFYRAAVRQAGGKEGAKLARTDVMHQAWLEEAFKWRASRARKLIVGWKLLGILDQQRLLQWNAEA